MLGLLRELGREAARRPGDDLLSALVAARDAGDRLDEDELTSAGFLLLAAGHETTVNLIANGVHACSPIPTSSRCCGPGPSCCPPRSRRCCATTDRSR